VSTADDLATLAESIARGAGATLLRFAREGVTAIETKSSGTDMVSEADRSAEAEITARLGEERPEDGILGEEGADRASRSGLTWVVDPLDGTTNFLYGYPSWCVSIACRDDAGYVAAAIFDPLRDESFRAVRGKGATLNGTPIAVTGCTDLAQALVSTGFAYDAASRGRQGTVLLEVLPRVRDIRRGGSAALDLAWVACGRLDGFFEVGLNEWDRAAGMLLIAEAGGRAELFPSPLGPPLLTTGTPGIYAPLSSLVRSATDAA
jgi:myo-inositol-1(or 4)-monophosphatase